jgi:hypothetical protein
MAQIHPTLTKKNARILHDGSHDDELFVFEHDSDAWSWKREAIKSREEAKDEVLGGGAGDGEGEGT